MQSGISASADLQKAFSTLLASPSQRALLAGISPAPEQLIPIDTVAASAADLTGDLDDVAAQLKDDAAAYVLLRESAERAIAVTYVPDHANVRSKMLFASSRLTLVRELGSEHFSSTLFATTREELTPAGWARHVVHGGLAAPLTEEERSLEGIKEAEASESTGTATRRGGHVVAGGVSMPIETKAVDALKRLADGNIAAVQLNIALPKETITLASTHSASEATPASLQSLLSTTQPRYTFYKHSATGTVLFIYTCPAGCSVKERMVYAASMRSIPVVALQEAGVDATKKLEASDPEEITETAVLQEFEPPPQAASAGGPSGGGFARPKRPGRR